MRPTLTTTDGLRLAGRHWETVGAPRAAVVIVHGMAASADCPHVEALAEAMHRAALDVVTYDARGHGSSEGESTLGDHEQHDVGAAVALARLRADRVVLVGASMGAIAAARYATTDADLAGVVLVSCPAHWKLPRNVRGILAAGMTRTRPGRVLVSRLSGVRLAAKWTNAAPPVDLVGRLQLPVAFVHGRDDRFIASDDAADLYRATPEPRRLTMVPHMGHAFGPLAIDAVDDAVEWVLDADERTQPGPARRELVAGV
jgi:alpha-beta hydrolase superfamily lysophospholipase